MHIHQATANIPTRPEAQPDTSAFNTQTSLTSKPACVVYPVRLQTWDELRIDDYIRSFPGARQMRLEDFVFFNKVSNFVCGLGENCLAGQVSLSKAKKKKRRRTKSERRMLIIIWRQTRSRYPHMTLLLMLSFVQSGLWSLGPHIDLLAMQPVSIPAVVRTLCVTRVEFLRQLALWSCHCSHHTSSGYVEWFRWNSFFLPSYWLTYHQRSIVEGTIYEWDLDLQISRQTWYPICKEFSLIISYPTHLVRG